MKYCGIYCITNLINGKKYVGQSIDITRRWSEEKARSKDVELQKRSPIYAALDKYGISNFDFSILEECAEEKLDDREWYWATTLNTFAPYGYNVAPCGSRERRAHHCAICGCIIGHGSTYCVDCGHKVLQVTERPDAETLANLLRQSSFAGVGRMFGVSDNTIRKWCRKYGLPTHSQDYKETKPLPRDYTVIQIDVNTDTPIQEFESPTAAARSLGHQKGNHISEVCNGKLTQCYGFKWRYKFPPQ